MSTSHIQTLRAMLATGGRVRVAVAYWGVGSLDRLDIRIRSAADNDIIVVCDLMSGACNPAEIERLQKILGESRVLTRDQLHAKVWLTDRGAIVGSSNASANGLGFEGDELEGSIEANIFVDNAETLAAISRWFENDVLGEARKITKPGFREAHRRWKRRRVTRPLLSKQGSLLGAIRVDPTSLANRNVSVWVYEHTGLSRWASRSLESEQKARRDNSIDCWENAERPPPAGAYVLDFDAVEGVTAQLDGLYQVLSDEPLRNTKNGTLLLCKPVKRILGLPLGDQTSWERAASAAAKSKPHREEWGIEDFRKRFLSSAA
jgi:PLD-like domain